MPAAFFLISVASVNLCIRLSIHFVLIFISLINIFLKLQIYSEYFVGCCRVFRAVNKISTLSSRLLLVRWGIKSTCKKFPSSSRNSKNVCAVRVTHRGKREVLQFMAIFKGKKFFEWCLSFSSER